MVSVKENSFFIHFNEILSQTHIPNSKIFVHLNTSNDLLSANVYNCISI